MRQLKTAVTAVLCATTFVVVHTAGAPAVSAAAPFHQTDFEGESIGDDPADWLDTGAFNSMAADDALFAIADAGGT